VNVQSWKANALTPLAAKYGAAGGTRMLRIPTEERLGKSKVNTQNQVELDPSMLLQQFEL
jgi:hypothetical protein